MLNGLTATGPDYRLAMYIAGLFMAGWAAILAWGWLKPFERKGLLLITAALILLSMVLEVALYRSLLGGPGFILGLSVRAALVLKFSVSYFYSRSGSSQ